MNFRKAINLSNYQMQEKYTQPFNLPNGTNHIKLQEAKESQYNLQYSEKELSESQANAKLSKTRERTTCSSQHIPNIHWFELLKLEITSTILNQKMIYMNLTPNYAISIRPREINPKIMSLVK